MSWNPDNKEIQALIVLPAAKRYEYSVKKIADQEQLWSLWRGGWCLASDDKGVQLVPVWPHSKYAEICACGVWAGYEPKMIELTAWLERWVPGMEKDNRKAVVFPTTTDKGVLVEPRRIEQDLRLELSRY